VNDFLVAYFVLSWCVAMPILWAKGQDRWLFTGLVMTAGLVWPIGAFFPADPDSWWARRQARLDPGEPEEPGA